MNDYRRIANYIGMALAVVGCLFVIYRLRQHIEQIDFSSLDKRFGLVFVALTGLYLGANYLLVYSWQQILRHLGFRLSWRQAHTIYGTSQLAKYVPGNVFQFVSRQAIGNADAIPHKILLKSSLLEISLLAASGCLFGILLLPIITPWFSPGISTLLFLFCCVVYVLGLHRSMGAHCALSGIGYILFLGITGTIFTCLTAFISPVSWQEHGIFVLAAYVISWLGGLVTPGAPAGIGVRELILTTLLGTTLPVTDFILAVLFARLVSIIADILFFGVSMTSRTINAHAQ